MILVDVNIFVDVLSGRDGFENSIKVIDFVRTGKLQGCISALTIPILWFLLQKWKDSLTAKEDVKNITNNFRIISLDNNILQNSLKNKMEDFEDAIQFCSALEGKCDTIITRNKKDFRSHDNLDILTPEEFLSRKGMK